MEAKIALEKRIRSVLDFMATSEEAYACDFLGYKIELDPYGKYCGSMKIGDRQFEDLKDAMKWAMDDFFEKVYKDEWDSIDSYEG